MLPAAGGKRHDSPPARDVVRVVIRARGEEVLGERPYVPSATTCGRANTPSAAGGQSSQMSRITTTISAMGRASVSPVRASVAVAMPCSD